MRNILLFTVYNECFVFQGHVSSAIGFPTYIYDIIIHLSVLVMDNTEINLLIHMMDYNINESTT